jgi:hypothetical protein
MIQTYKHSIITFFQAWKHEKWLKFHEGLLSPSVLIFISTKQQLIHAKNQSYKNCQQKITMSAKNRQRGAPSLLATVKATVAYLCSLQISLKAILAHHCHYH